MLSGITIRYAGTGAGASVGAALRMLGAGGPASAVRLAATPLDPLHKTAAASVGALDVSEARTHQEPSFLERAQHHMHALRGTPGQCPLVRTTTSPTHAAFSFGSAVLGDVVLREVVVPVLPGDRNANALRQSGAAPLAHRPDCWDLGTAVLRLGPFRAPALVFALASLSLDEAEAALGSAGQPVDGIIGRTGSARGQLMLGGLAGLDVRLCELDHVPAMWNESHASVVDGHDAALAGGVTNSDMADKGTCWTPHHRAMTGLLRGGAASKPPQQPASSGYRMVE